MKPTCKCTPSAEYRQYCLKVTGCDDKGNYFGRPVQTEKEAEAVTKATDTVPAAAPVEDRNQASSIAEEKARLEAGFKVEEWPSPEERKKIRLVPKVLRKGSS